MIKGIQTRLTAHKILLLLKNNKNLDEILNLFLIKNKFSESDKKMIHNIVLSSMRYDIHVKKIITKYIKKKVNLQQYILFLSAITQIVFLDFKEYAVVNTTVEISKNKKVNVNSGFVNAVLKRIAKDKLKLKKNIINFDELPKWFLKEVKNLKTNEQNMFLDSITQKPSLHLVFKERISNNFNEIELFKTSTNSAFILKTSNIENLPDYASGTWWVQDFSSMLPLSSITDFKKKKVIDMCSAPGGKAFQTINADAEVDMIEISHKRAKILKENLVRLNFKGEIIILDALEIEEKKKYDYVIIDAPCSSVGTIKKNPEIFFRKSNPKINDINKNSR